MHINDARQLPAILVTREYVRTQEDYISTIYNHDSLLIQKFADLLKNLGLRPGGIIKSWGINESDQVIV